MTPDTQSVNVTNMTDTATLSTTHDLDGDIIDQLCQSGFEPADAYADLFTESGHDRPSTATINYFAAGGVDAVRHNGDTITFARWDVDENYAKIVTTTVNGVILSEATFSLDRIGCRAFLTVADLRP